MKMDMKFRRTAPLCLAAALLAPSLQAVDITLKRPYSRWLFGGLGFQNSEANLVPLMSDEFRDQFALKTFMEISPTFSRTVAGFEHQSKASLDRFADFYDMAFRKAGTTLYVYPLAMPENPDLIDRDEYAENVAEKLDYLVNKRNCRKIRWYCLTNELQAGRQGRWFWTRMDLFKEYCIALWKAFRRHRLEIGIVATDIGTAFPYDIPNSIMWAKTNMGSFCDVFCGHWYFYGRDPEDLTNWDYLNEHMDSFTKTSFSGGKRFILGEYGFNPHYRTPGGPMGQDTGYAVTRPDLAVSGALLKAEIAMSAVNNGVFAAASWSFCDFPDPFFHEPSDVPEEQVRHEAGLCAFNSDYKYNKWGCFRWNQHDRDYRAYPELYAVGHLMRLFKKGSTVLPCEQADLAEIRANLPKTVIPIPCADPRVMRASAIQNEDGSVTVALLNRGEDGRRVNVRSTLFSKPARRYDFNPAKVPDNPFNDLQPYSETIEPGSDGTISFTMAKNELTIITSDYEDVRPAAVTGVRVEGGALRWDPSKSPDHRYYRVYLGGKQIASTVATSLKVADASGDYSVRSVDKWLNLGE